MGFRVNVELSQVGGGQDLRLFAVSTLGCWDELIRGGLPAPALSIRKVLLLFFLQNDLTSRPSEAVLWVVDSGLFPVARA